MSGRDMPATTIARYSTSDLDGPRILPGTEDPRRAQ